MKKFSKVCFLMLGLGLMLSLGYSQGPKNPSCTGYAELCGDVDGGGYLMKGGCIPDPIIFN